MTPVEPKHQWLGRAGDGGKDGPRLMAMALRDVRWAFTWPYSWLIGIGVNLVLSGLYLLWVPLISEAQVDWAILVGTYFSVFVLADVTSTNQLGVDAEETRLRLDRGTPLIAVLVAKNVTLFAVVGVPTLLITGLITAYVEPEYRLVLTLPGVVYPILTWLGVGNIMSVLMPYEPLPLRVRWAERRELRATVYWGTCLLLPYSLCVAIDRTKVWPRLIGDALQLPATDSAHGLEVTVLGLIVWGLSSALAVALARRRMGWWAVLRQPSR